MSIFTSPTLHTDAREASWAGHTATVVVTGIGRAFINF